MMQHTYLPRGVCSKRFELRLSEDGIIEQLLIEGGCEGNLQGIMQLVRGRRADEVIDLLQGVTCGGKTTSCPDQLAQALREATGK